MSCVLSTYLYGACECMFLSRRVHLHVHLTYVCTCDVSLHVHVHLTYVLVTIECGFTLKDIRDGTRTYSQMHRTDKYLEQSSIIWPAWLSGWVFIYELNSCRFESSCIHLNFRFRGCLKQGIPWHSGNCRVWIRSETGTWRDKNIQLNSPYR